MKKFTEKELQYIIALHVLTQLKTSSHYPQSNEIVERFHGTIKKEYIRKNTLLDQDHTKKIIGSYIGLYKNQCLHSTNAFIASADQLGERDIKISEERGKRFTWPD